MKTNFIYIENIDQIDTSKISVYDLNKRFIDSNGIMYGLKYNRKTRKVDVIRVLRTTSDRAQAIQSRIFEKKREDYLNREKARSLMDEEESSRDAVNEDAPLNSPTSASSQPESGDASSSEGPEDQTLETIESISEEFNPDIFVKNMFETLNLHKDRFRGVIHNIQNSKLIVHDDRERFNNLDDTIRSLEIDGFQKMDELVSSYREIHEYPRPVSYYVTQLDSQSRDLINLISTDKEKYHFIILYKMNEDLRRIYKKLLNSTERFFEILHDLEAEVSSKTTSLQRQNLTDARYTLETTGKEIKEVLTNLTVLEAFVQDQHNFIA